MQVMDVFLNTVYIIYYQMRYSPRAVVKVVSIPIGAVSFGVVTRHRRRRWGREWGVVSPHQKRGSGKN